MPWCARCACWTHCSVGNVPLPVTACSHAVSASVSLSALLWSKGAVLTTVSVHSLEVVRCEPLGEDRQSRRSGGAAGRWAISLNFHLLLTRVPRQIVLLQARPSRWPRMACTHGRATSGHEGTPINDQSGAARGVLSPLCPSPSAAHSSLARGAASSGLGRLGARKTELGAPSRTPVSRT